MVEKAPVKDLNARIVSKRHGFRKTYHFESGTVRLPTATWSESEYRELFEAQKVAPVKVAFDQSATRAWWMFREEFYCIIDSSYAGEYVKQMIRAAAWREDLKTRQLPEIVSNPHKLSRHPMETTEREGFFLNPREPEKLAEWTEEKSKYCEKFWSVELDRYLIVSIEQHGVFWPKPFWKTTKGIVQDAVRSHPLGVDALDPDNRWLGSEWEGERRRLAQSTVWTEIGWAFQRYACRRASQIPAAINAYARRLAEQSEYQRCLLCTWQFRPCDLPDYLYVEGEGEGDFCHTCLMTMITHDPRGHDVSRIPLRKQDMTAALARLVELMGFVPPQNFNSIETLLRVERRRRPNVVAYIWTMRNPNEYKRKFGSWLKALIAAEVLDDDCYPTGIGTKCIARDGHECRSLEEKQIDDWFFEAGITHRTEPFYPYHPELNPSKRSRADWEVDEVFVEYWGLIGDRQYDRRIKNKRKLAQESGIVLIELYPSDLQNLSLKLGQLRKVD